MTLRDRIPVEPLEGARLDRVEQRIVAEAGPLLARPRRAPWTSWAIAGAAALAAASVVIALGVGRGRRGEAALPAPPVAVATDARGTRVDLGDALVEVGPDTRFAVVRAGGGIAIELGAGDIALEVPPRRARPPLWVHAGDVGVRVVGTGFRVHRHDTVEVEVTHGAVEVHRGPTLARVAGGERWSSVDGAVVAVAGLAARPDGTTVAVAADGAGGATTAAGVRDPAADRPSTIAAGALALAPTAAGPDLRDRRATPLPAPRAPTSAMAMATTATAPPSPPAPAARAPRDRARVATAATPLAPTPPTPRPPADLRAELLAQPMSPAPLLPPGKLAATAEERAHVYRDLAFKKGRDDTDAAMWGYARTLALELGQERDALRILDAYVGRFSSGAQLEAVLWLRLRLLCARDLDAPCRAAAHSYVARFPGGSKGDLAVRVTQGR